MNKLWEYFRDGKFISDLKFWVTMALIVFGFLWYKSCNEKIELGQKPDVSYKLPDKVYTDEKGVQHAQQTTQVTTTSVLNSLVDSLISENRNLKNAISLVQVSTKIDTVFIQKIKWIDSTSGDFQISKKDEWIDLSVEGNIKSGESSIRLQTNDTISVVTTQKKHLFKPDETLIDISLRSPYHKIGQMRSISVEDKRSVLVLGPQVGYNPFNGKVTYGVGVTLNLLSLKLRK